MILLVPLLAHSKNGSYFYTGSYYKFLEENNPDLLDGIKFNITKWAMKLWTGEKVENEVKNFLVTELAKDKIVGFSLDKKQSASA